MAQACAGARASLLVGQYCSWLQVHIAGMDKRASLHGIELCGMHAPTLPNCNRWHFCPLATPETQRHGVLVEGVLAAVEMACCEPFEACSAAVAGTEVREATLVTSQLGKHPSNQVHRRHRCG